MRSLQENLQILEGFGPVEMGRTRHSANRFSSNIYQTGH
ncbi:hypothetical protein SAMN05192529_11196 [Arachidicoccus rhizosphaerae]|jgi:hypothetical protein|uniref:Uncharacterized protein n=1 Tax=Arachidicoccus rhizosphaerae TaxID=551991 RepID=A0A1H3ZMC7_9BACT|nr:hypothetical protein SAMN05192529_11196 [Arachidicoccus rhizosphaerae]